MEGTMTFFKYRFSEKTKKIFNISLKVLAVVLSVVFFWHVLSNPYYTISISTMNAVLPTSAGRIIMNLIFAFSYGATAILITSPFFSFRSTSKAVRYFIPIVIIIRFAFARNIMICQLGVGVYDSIKTYFAIPQFFIQNGLMIVLCLGEWIKFFFNDQPVFNKKEFTRSMLIGLLTLVLCSLLNAPFTFLAAVFGPAGQVAIDFTFSHRAIIYLTFILPFILMFIFKNKPYHVRWYLLLHLSLCAFYSFFRRTTISDLGDPTALPLHLCNTGVIIMLIAFTFRNKPCFYFAYLINVLGALFATLMPNKNGDAFSTLSMQFWNNHMADISIPFLAVGLKIFERPKFKYVAFSIAAFTVYFLLVAFLDAFYGPRVDYFFLNGDKFYDIIEWSKPIRDATAVHINLGDRTMTIYTVYWLLIYLVYCCLTFAMWFLYSFAYRVSDLHMDMEFKHKRNKLLKKERAYNATLTKEEGTMIEISHLTKVYGKSEQKAVNDFSLTVQPGDVFGFLGHNGAGKSTLIKCLTGIQPITDGSIKIFGHDVATEPKITKRMIGYVPDNHAVYEGLTGREYVNYIADLYMVTTEERKQRLEKYAEMFKITAALDKPIKDYSHGMKQKITIIAALIHNPKVWILDEPLTGLDPYSCYQIKQCMKEHAAQGNIVFFSSHVIDVVENVCTRIAIISHGVKQYEADLKDLKEKGISLEDIYLKYVANADSR